MFVHVCCSRERIVCFVFISNSGLTKMARFRAYTSDSSDDDDQSIQDLHDTSSDSKQRAQGSKKAPANSEREEDSDSHHGLTSGEESSGSTSSVSSQRRKKSRHTQPKRITARSQVSEEEGDDVLYGDEVAIRAPTTSPPPGHPADPTILPWAQQVGVDSQRMHVMQTSLFRMPEEAATLKVVHQPPPARSTIRKPISSLNRKHSRDSEGDGLRGEPRERASFAHDIEPAPYRPFRKFARVDGTSSAATGHEGAFFDAGLAFGRSFRVGWGPGGT
ncbi:hypothetical protein M378DRAFT_198555, partial [Amanita muscaria Koide BX008]